MIRKVLTFSFSNLSYLFLLFFSIFTQNCHQRFMVQKILLTFFLTAVPICNSNCYAEGAVIGIFGDIHGDKAIAIEVLQQMRNRGVTHIIGTGDFVRYEGPQGLNEILSYISPLTGVLKENIFLFPGNWEHETGFNPETMNKIIRLYGQLVFQNYDGYGFVNIAGERIMVSHFPQHNIPEEFLPPPRFRLRIDGQAFVMDTVQRGHYPPNDVVFAIFAHNHIGGAFIDTQSGKIVVNPGVLDAKTKSPQEPRAYSIYSQDDATIRFINADTNQVVNSVQVPSLDNGNSTCPLYLGSIRLSR